MKSVLSRWSSIMAMVVFAAAVQAQQVDPRLGYVYPAGGRRGETFRVTIGGQRLDGAAQALLSGNGVQAAVVEHTKPMTQKQYNELREQARQLQERKAAAMKDRHGDQDMTDAEKPVAWSAEDERTLVELRRKLAANAPNRQANPALAESVTLDVTVLPGATPGRRELRLLTKAGLTNPLVFCVGQLPEFREKAAQNTGDQRNPASGRAFPGRRGRAEDPEMNITLPAVVNGQILPGDVDRYRFTARKGQRLVVAVSARELIPYLADAVPGWFQATLAVYDAHGRELAYEDDFRFDPDPVLGLEVPEDGEYVLEIKDSIYRGREDFVYRMTVGELPFVTSIFPWGGPAGAPTTVTLEGWNLPTARLVKRGVGREMGSEIVALENRPSSMLHHESFMFDTLAECLERGGDDASDSAQEIVLPVIVNGRIDHRGDQDVFSLEGRAGQVIVAEVYARRLGSPLDSLLRLTDGLGRQLALNDDHEDRGFGLLTHHADSRLCVVLPTDGLYHLHLTDAQNQGGSAYGYRLRVSPPQPDFALRVVPSGINVRGGTTIPLTVYALRRDGFDGDITLALKDAPNGFRLDGWIPAGRERVQVTLTVPPLPTEEPLSLSAEGRALIAGRAVIRPVVPADDMMQAFFYQHLVPAQEFKVFVSGKRMAAGSVRLFDEIPIRIPAGGTTAVRIGASGRSFGGALHLEVSDPSEGIAIHEVTMSRGVAQITLRCEATKIKPGLKGNLIINGFYTRPAAGKNPAPANRPRVPNLTLPAIPFEIVAP